jgi:transcriptional regulator with XRE-family HTH domain
MRKAKGITLEKLAELSGLSVSYLSRLEKSGRNLSLKNMNLIARALGGNAPDLLPVASTHHRIKLEGEVQAGKWRSAEQSDIEPEFFDIPLPEAYAALRPFAVRVMGSSMNLVYPEGTILICCHLAELQENPIPGKRYIIEDIDQGDGIETTVKEFVLDQDGNPWAWPRSSHPEFQQPFALDVGRPGHTIMIKARVIFALTRE